MKEILQIYKTVEFNIKIINCDGKFKLILQDFADSNNLPYCVLHHRHMYQVLKEIYAKLKNLQEHYSIIYLSPADPKQF